VNIQQIVSEALLRESTDIVSHRGEVVGKRYFGGKERGTMIQMHVTPTEYEKGYKNLPVTHEGSGEDHIPLHQFLANHKSATVEWDTAALRNQAASELENHRFRDQVPAIGVAASVHRTQARAAMKDAMKMHENYAPDKDFDTSEYKHYTTPDLVLHAIKLPVHQFLDKFVAEGLPEHMDHGLNPAKVVHDRVPIHSIDPSELDDWAPDHQNIKDRSEDYANRIKATGSKNSPPILLRGHHSDTRYRPTVIDGHARTLAHIAAGETHINAVYDAHTLASVWKHVNDTKQSAGEIVHDYVNKHLPTRKA
jgi:hypothetical protein